MFTPNHLLISVHSGLAGAKDFATHDANIMQNNSDIIFSKIKQEINPLYNANIKRENIVVPEVITLDFEASEYFMEESRNSSLATRSPAYEISSIVDYLQMASDVPLTPIKIKRLSSALTLHGAKKFRCAYCRYQSVQNRNIHRQIVRKHVGRNKACLRLDDTKRTEGAECWVVHHRPLPICNSGVF